MSALYSNSKDVFGNSHSLHDDTNISLCYFCYFVNVLVPVQFLINEYTKTFDDVKSFQYLSIYRNVEGYYFELN